MTNTEAFSVLKNPVVFIDSGIGGLPYHEHFREKLPLQDTVYFADTANFPYGTKTEHEINNALGDAITKIINQCNPALVVVACNTMSVTSLAFLRSKFSVPFVGVVPAIKPAALNSPSGKIGVLATAKTIETPYLDNLIEDFASDCIVERYGDPDIVTIVEHSDSIPAAQKELVLKKIADYFSVHPVDSLILACTHFIHIADDLQRVLGPGIQIIDSRAGVIRQAIRVLTDNGLVTANKGTALFYTSGSDKDFPRLEKSAAQYGLEFRGRF
ncbi:MAG: glutamate racemase [Spirochaetales bacterium]|nr:glutamate racemase [Spirochaetales bacterium]